MPLDAAVQRLFTTVPFDHISDVGVERFREVYLARTALAPSRIELAEITDLTIDDGVGVRIYRPVAEPGALPVVVFFHGGGWTVGNLDTHDNIAREIALQVGALVVSVDYRLAPEHPFPAAADDAWTALQWVARHAPELGGDPARLAVAGDSAGGNLAAVVALQARSAGPALAFQLLFYPVTLLEADLDSMRQNAEAPVLNVTDMELYQHCYIGDLSPAQGPPTLVPGRAPDLSGLPPAYIATAEYDPLRDDGARYAQLLRDNGVAVQHRDHHGLTHGFVGYVQWVPTAAQALSESLAALKAAL